MLQNCPFDTWHAIMSILSGNEIYCSSDLMARYSSWIEYLKWFLRIGWTNGILCILNRWNFSNSSTRGMCSRTYKVFNIMNDPSFINLFMYHIFSLFHSGKANLGCGTNLVSNLISSDMRSKGFNKAGVSFVNLWLKLGFRIDKMSILTECIHYRASISGFSTGT